jgi:hypothetical protein
VTDERGADAVLNVLEVDATILQARLESNRVMWPEQAPPLDGVIVCCDVSKKDSFAAVEDVLRLCTLFTTLLDADCRIAAFRPARLPIVALACKCDLESHLDLKKVCERLSMFDIGLVKVTISNEAGKNRLRLAFDWLLRAINHNRRSLAPLFGLSLQDSNLLTTFLGTDHFDAINYQNPASPEVLTITPPWEIQRSDTATPTAAMNLSSDLSQAQVPLSTDAHPAMHSTSPVPMRSTGDLHNSNAEATTESIPVHDKSQDVVEGEAESSASAVSLNVPGAELSILTDSAEPTDDIPEDRPGVPERDR